MTCHVFQLFEMWSVSLIWGAELVHISSFASLQGLTRSGVIIAWPFVAVLRHVKRRAVFLLREEHVAVGQQRSAMVCCKTTEQCEQNTSTGPRFNDAISSTKWVTGKLLSLKWLSQEKETKLRCEKSREYCVFGRKCPRSNSLSHHLFVYLEINSFLKDPTDFCRVACSKKGEMHQT